MFKKLFAIILAALLCFSCVGCGEKNKDANESQENTAVVSSEIPVSSELSFESNAELEVNANNMIACASCGDPFEAVLGHIYCDSCRCWTTTCRNPRTDGSSYCIEHKCLMCDALASTSYSQYCSEHRCHKYGCEYPAISGENYCTAHLT